MRSRIMSHEEQENELKGVLENLYASSLSLDVAICHNFISSQFENHSDLKQTVNKRLNGKIRFLN